MRRFAVAGIACLSLGIAAALPAIGSADSAGPQISGSGLLNPFIPNQFENRFNIDNIRSNPDGSNPAGQASVDGKVGSDGNDVEHRFGSGHPLCVKIVGNQATFVIAFNRTINEGDFAGAQFWVTDNGKPQGGPAVDGAINDRLTAAQLAKASCNTPAPRPIKTIAKGDITIANS
jgi:hypothetical protein